LGQSATATNLLASKQGSFNKTQGFSTLSSTDPETSVSALGISRLTSKDYGLVAVADANPGGESCVWSYDEAGNNLFLNDRISEVYIPPTDTVLAQSDTPDELDTCVCQLPGSPYELHVGLFADGLIYYSVTQATVEVGTTSVSRSFVVPTSGVTVLDSLGHTYAAPKVILVDNQAVLTVADAAGGTIYGTSLDMLQPWQGWTIARTLTTTAAQPAFPGISFGNNPTGVYDTCTIDDTPSSAIFLLAYFNTSNLFVIQQFDNTFGALSVGTIADAALSGKLPTAIAVRANISDGAAWIAYAYWSNGSTTQPTTTVNAAALVYPSLAASFSTPCVLAGGLTNGNNFYPPPQLIDIKPVPGTVNGFGDTQQVVWSPPPLPRSGVTSYASPVTIGANEYNSDISFPSSFNTPCAAIFQAACYPFFGATQLHHNQPRWTNGATLASRMAVITDPLGAAHAYLAGWIPSSNLIPGADSLQNFQVTNPGGGYAINVNTSSNTTPNIIQVAYPPQIIFDNAGTGGSGAQATVAVSTTPGATFGQIVGVDEISGGSGYTSKPTVNGGFSGTLGAGTASFGTGFSGTVTYGSLGNFIDAAVVSGGTGYNTVPNSVPIILTALSALDVTGFFGYAVVNAAGVIAGISVVSQGVADAPGTYSITDATGGFSGTISYDLAEVTSQDIQGTFYLFCMDTFSDATSPNGLGGTGNVPLRMCGLWRPRLGKIGMFATAHVLPHLVANPNASATGNLFQTDLPIDVSSLEAVGTACSADFGNEYSYHADELGGLVGFAGGLPCLYDGCRTADYAFPYYPENVVQAPNSPSTVAIGANIPSGTYQYIAIYTRKDSQGNIHRSGRSVAATVSLPTGAGPYLVTLNVPTMGYSTAQRGLSAEDVALGIPLGPAETVELYRTENGGTNFHSIRPWTVPGQLPVTTFPANSLSVPFVQIQDGITDADLVNNPLLYGDGSDGITPGSIVDNLCPPPLQGLITHKQRWWGYDGNQVWYTKAWTDGEGPGWNELFAFSVDDGPGNITALATMDERLFIFKRDRIFYVTGDGPDDNGSQQDLQPPQRVQSDVGCINWRSVIGTPAGLWFQSDNGLYVMTRKLEVQPSGKFVEDTLAAYPDITSATLDMRNGLVVFTANGPSPTVPGDTIGTLILYSWVLDTWSTGVLNSGDSLAPELESAVLSGPSLAYTTTDGVSAIYRQTTGTGAGSYFVNGQYQSLDWVSPWTHSPSPQGWMRAEMINLLWDDPDPHALTVQVAYNYSNVWVDSWTVGATSQAARTTPLVQWQFQPTVTQIESLRIRVTDAADATVPPISGEGPTLIGVSLQYVDLGGNMRFSISQRGSAP
jgi:hypothetical protein